MKIIFSNGESVEFDATAIPQLTIQYTTELETDTPTRDFLSSDHIRSLCNMLFHATKLLTNEQMDSGQKARYYDAIEYALERADQLEGRGNNDYVNSI